MPNLYWYNKNSNNNGNERSGYTTDISGTTAATSGFIQPSDSLIFLSTNNSTVIFNTPIYCDTINTSSYGGVIQFNSVPISASNIYINSPSFVSNLANLQLLNSGTVTVDKNITIGGYINFTDSAYFNVANTMLLTVTGSTSGWSNKDLYINRINNSSYTGEFRYSDGLRNFNLNNAFVDKGIFGIQFTNSGTSTIVTSSGRLYLIDSATLRTNSTSNTTYNCNIDISGNVSWLGNSIQVQAGCLYVSGTLTYNNGNPFTQDRFARAGFCGNGAIYFRKHPSLPTGITRSGGGNGGYVWFDTQDGYIIENGFVDAIYFTNNTSHQNAQFILPTSISSSANKLIFSGNGQDRKFTCFNNASFFNDIDLSNCGLRFTNNYNLNGSLNCYTNSNILTTQDSALLQKNIKLLNVVGNNFTFEGLNSSETHTVNISAMNISGGNQIGVRNNALIFVNGNINAYNDFGVINSNTNSKLLFNNLNLYNNSDVSINSASTFGAYGSPPNITNHSISPTNIFGGGRFEWYSNSGSFPTSSIKFDCRGGLYLRGYDYIAQTSGNNNYIVPPNQGNLSGPISISNINDNLTISFLGNTFSTGFYIFPNEGSTLPSTTGSLTLNFSNGYLSNNLYSDILLTQNSYTSSTRTLNLTNYTFYTNQNSINFFGNTYSGTNIINAVNSELILNGISGYINLDLRAIDSTSTSGLNITLYDANGIGEVYLRSANPAFNSGRYPTVYDKINLGLPREGRVTQYDTNFGTNIGTRSDPYIVDYSFDRILSLTPSPSGDGWTYFKIDCKIGDKIETYFIGDVLADPIMEIYVDKTYTSLFALVDEIDVAPYHYPYFIVPETRTYYVRICPYSFWESFGDVSYISTNQYGFRLNSVREDSTNEGYYIYDASNYTYFPKINTLNIYDVLFAGSYSTPINLVNFGLYDGAIWYQSGQTVNISSNFYFDGSISAPLPENVLNIQSSNNNIRQRIRVQNVNVSAGPTKVNIIRGRDLGGNSGFVFRRPW